jgi:glycosyltransferase involved in cell wall biosynthesis
MGQKRIAVVTSDVPFVEGGHLIIARSTVRALKEKGYEADLVLTPQNRFGRVFQAYLATRLIDVAEDGLGRGIDQVISLRFPSFAVKHPVHVCWLNHRLREYYDLWESYAASLSFKTRFKEQIKRAMLHKLDRRLLTRNVTRLFVQSGTIQDRLKTWGNIPSEVLYPPPPQRPYRTDGYGDFILAVSRLQRLKRLDLLVEAFASIRNKNLKAVIIGDGPEQPSLERRIRELDLAGRISLIGSTDEESLLDYYAGCRAVFFSPFHEDYGFITVEAFASGKAVLTTSDSGGPAELVRDGESGFVVPADAKAVAARLDELAEDKALAEKMGQSGRAFVSGLSWDRAVEKLVIA